MQPLSDWVRDFTRMRLSRCRPLRIDAAAAVLAALGAACARAQSSTATSGGAATPKKEQPHARWGSYGAHDENVSRINYYDPKSVMGRTRGVSIVCRHKTFVRSYSERLWHYLKPMNTNGETVVESFQLMKLLALIGFPVVCMVWWKSVFIEYPDYWEQQAASLQSRPLNESDTGTKTPFSYFDIIQSLETKREAALRRKGHSAEDGSQTSRTGPLGAVPPGAG